MRSCRSNRLGLKAAAASRALILLLAVVWLIEDGRSLPAAEPEPAAPLACLFDTGAVAAAPLPGAAIRDRKGWTALAEDDLTHKFAGDAVLLNDRLAIVLRSQAAGAEVYGLARSGPVHRATIDPVIARVAHAARVREDSTLSSLRILENNPGAVMVEAEFRGQSAARLTFRLTTGQAILELRPGEGADRVHLDASGRYMAVPDFFGDDMLFAAERITGSRLGLPAENFFIEYLGQGDALLMGVWPSNRQQAAAFLEGEGPKRMFRSSEIGCIAGKSLWIALLEGEGIWHEQFPSAAGAGPETVLNWKPPFPAKWRGSLAAPSAAARSWYFSEAEDGEAPGERSPCCFENQRAVVRGLPSSTVPADQAAAPLVVYPLDRNRATPLAAFCPIDVLRATLGVGPCQYILQTEGLASDANPTPDNVMTFVEKQFAKKRAKKSADEIREVLDAMVAHVEHAQARIAKYAALAADLRSAAGGEVAKELDPAIGHLERAAAAPGLARPAEQARKQADEVLALIGKDNAAVECRRLGGELRLLGAAQDRAMANSRMAARWVRQLAAQTAARSPAAAQTAAGIQARIDQTLGSK